MINSLKINKIVDKLISTVLIKGAQPDELITAIFEAEYEKIETFKVVDQIHFIMTFEEVVDDDSSTVKMKYVYNEYKKLLKIEQKIGSGKFKVQWDRNEEINRLLDELFLLTDGDSALIEKIRVQIPDDVSRLINLRLVS